VTRSVANPTRLGERPTAGRLTGLSASEADRGERALWLSGDGHRAALFHLGALTRLNELGLLAGLRAIGAASGGSIAAAMLATRVEWPLDGSFPEWEGHVAEPLREIASEAFEEGRSGHPRRPFPGIAGEAALEERFARELLAGAGGRGGRGPSFVFGAPGLALSGIGAKRADGLGWDIVDTAPEGYGRELLAEMLADLHTGL
jgi:NTE family protein